MSKPPWAIRQAWLCAAALPHGGFSLTLEIHEDFKVASEDMWHAYGVYRVGSIGPSQRLTYPALLGQNTRLCFRVRQL